MNDRERLHAYLDGELSPEEVADVERALASDPDLVAELEALRGVDEALGALPGCEAPADLADRVLAKARRPRRRVLALLVPLAAAAAALLAVTLREAQPPAPQDPFSLDEHLGYVWEADAETFGTLALGDLEERILQELETT